MGRSVRINYEGDDDGIDDVWIEMSSWSRRDSLDLKVLEDLDPASWEDSNSQYAAVLRRRIDACNLLMADGSRLTDPSEISPDTLLDLEIAVVIWLPVAVFSFVGKQQKLGEVARLRLFRTSDLVSAETTTTGPDSQTAKSDADSSSS